MLSTDDVIVAVASPGGPGARAVIRLSGRRALESVEKVLSGSPAAEIPSWGARAVEMAVGSLRLPAWLCVFRAPRSYTREDLVEIHVPSSAPVLAALARDLAAQEGVRFAGPGEFTLRAFLNGRLDLSQAEAVAQLIASAGEQEARAARRGLDGDFSRRVDAIRAQIVEAMALLEAAIDFPEEELPANSSAEVANRLRRAESGIRALRQASRLRLSSAPAFRVVIWGCPNAGKSSLLNRIVGRSAALVSEHAGTTRDPVRAVRDHDGTLVEWVDVAGAQSLDEQNEVHGLERGLDSETLRALRRLTRIEIEHADLVLWVLDLTMADARNIDAARSIERPALVVANKVDLIDSDRAAEWLRATEIPVIFTSALRGDGVAELISIVLDRARGKRPDAPAGGADPDFVISAHQEAALLECRESTARALSALEAEGGYEYVAMDLRQALGALERLTGKVTADEILGQIFSRFCIGK